MINKKIRNATPTVFCGIHFKSKLEVSCYKTLLSCGFTPVYEGTTYTIVDSFNTETPYWTHSKSSRKLKKQPSKVRAIHYTPDFTFSYKGYTVIIEVKGIPNELFPMRMKLFRKYMEQQKEKFIFFEVHTKANVLEVCNILKSL